MAPPWQLVSPSGVIHVVRDEIALKELAAQEPDLMDGRKNRLRTLVDPQGSKSLDELPQHQKHWQLLQRVVWLQRVDNGMLLPIVGGDGNFYVNTFCGRHSDQGYQRRIPNPKKP